ncbi:hypothetical protein CUN63_17680 [Pseudomonas sp. ACM7]|nr:hypothetical protein CUN63_17680 [Pseudomonas sp. ACM7]
MHQSPCGSGLARECVGSNTINFECQIAFASKPAPTGFVSRRMSETKTERSHAPFFVQVEITCRLAFP